jgi:rhodanese-related sulfurtransferase
MLAIDYASTGDLALAMTVSRHQTTLPVGMKVVSLEAVAGYLDRGGAVPPFTLVDVRSSESYAAAHLPGAISVSLQRIEKRPAGILPDDRTAALVFYDEGAGDDAAVKAATIARKAGYADVAVFPDGVIGWQRSGRFLTPANSFIRKSAPIIIDLRAPEQVDAGHMEKAISIPAAHLADSSGLFPMERGVPIVVYGENDAEALAAARTIRSWGYRRVTVYLGGVAAWLASAEVLTAEPVDTTIPSSSMTKGGPLSPKDFEMAILSTGSVQVVDVRSEADYAKGHLGKSVHIPLQQLSARHGELNRELIQVVFGDDDTQSEIAADFLKQKNYRVNYLKGRVTFQGDGKYQVK